jgi:hypothetical protein
MPIVMGWRSWHKKWHPQPGSSHTEIIRFIIEERAVWHTSEGEVIHSTAFREHLQSYNEGGIE